jgi:type IV pilus assembly protein PilM
MNLLGFGRRSVLGIDIGAHSIKMVEMRVDGEKPLITRAEYVSMDISLEREGEIQRAMKDLIEIAKPRSRKAVTDIPSSDEMVVMRTLFIPDVTSDMSDEEITETTKSEVEEQDYIPYPIDNALISSDLLGETTVNGERGMEIFFVAVHKGLSEERALLLRRFGIQTLAIDVDVLALARLIGNMETLSDEESIAVIDMGASKSSIFFYLQGKPIFYPHIPGGGNELTEEISREFQVEWDEAERMKIELDDPVVEAVLRAAMERPQGLVQALRGCFEYYMADYPAPTKVILTGGTAQSPFMEEFLSSKLELPVERINYLDQFKLDEERDLKPLEDNQALFATAIGLALKVRG